MQLIFAQLRRVTDRSPIALMKAVKNDVEIAGMRNAHVSDSLLSLLTGYWQIYI